MSLLVVSLSCADLLLMLVVGKLLWNRRQVRILAKQHSFVYDEERGWCNVYTWPYVWWYPSTQEIWRMNTLWLIALAGLFLADLLLTLRIILRILARIITARQFIPHHANFVISREPQGRLHMRIEDCNCHIRGDRYNVYAIEH